jgi:hypothetical protein
MDEIPPFDSLPPEVLYRISEYVDFDCNAAVRSSDLTRIRVYRMNGFYGASWPHDRWNIIKFKRTCKTFWITVTDLAKRR